MGVLFILGCILSLITVSEMHPHYHRPLQIHPTVISSASQNWPYDGLSRVNFQAPISPPGQYPGFIGFNNQPIIPQNWPYDDLSQVDFQAPISPPGQYPGFIGFSNQPIISQNGFNQEHRDLPTMNSSAANDEESFRGFYTREPKSLFESRPSYVEPLDHLASRGGMEGSLGEGAIVFPESEPQNDVFIPACAAENASCKDLEDNIPYPLSRIAKAVEAAIAEEDLDLFGNDNDTEEKISLRIDGDDDFSICSSWQRMLYPKAARNKVGDWSYIINVDKLQQGVRAETCREDGVPMMFTKHLPYDTTISCKQKYMYRKFLYINENGKVLSDFFQVPSCCACFVKASGEIVQRTGDPKTYNLIDSNDSLNEDDIDFHGSNTRRVSFLPPGGIKGPPCAGGRTFCDKYKNYPTDYITNAVNSKSEEYLTLFGFDDIPEGKISQRIDDPDESSICPSYQYVVYPKTAQNEDGKWFYIVNTDKLKQSVQVETCLNKVTPWMFDDNNSNFKARCEQKYMNVKLLFLNEYGDIKFDFFVLPSCCKCSVQYTGKIE